MNEGDMGLLIWDMLCLAALTGLLSFLVLSFAHLLVELCVVALWLAVHVQLKRKVCVCVCVCEYIYECVCILSKALLSRMQNRIIIIIEFDMPCPVLSCPVLPCPVLPCPVLPCPEEL